MAKQLLSDELWATIEPLFPPLPSIVYLYKSRRWRAAASPDLWCQGKWPKSSMKDLWELFEKLLSALSLPITGWTVALFLLVFILRKRIEELLNKTLDWIGSTLGGEWGYWRFWPKYRAYIRESHLYMKLVGIRTEGERRPKIIDAYVPIEFVPAGGRIESASTIENIIQTASYALILGDPGAGKSTVLDHLIVEYSTPKANVNSSFFRKLFPRRKAAFNLLPIYVPLRRCSKNNETLLDDILD